MNGERAYKHDEKSTDEVLFSVPAWDEGSEAAVYAQFSDPWWAWVCFMNPYVGGEAPVQVTWKR